MTEARHLSMPGFKLKEITISESDKLSNARGMLYEIPKRIRPPAPLLIFPETRMKGDNSEKLLI